MTFDLNVLWIILAGVLGGMLINYLADVLPVYRRFVAPRCLQCQAKIPLLNYLFFPRVCPNCHHKRTPRTWLVELILIGGALWIFSGYQGRYSPLAATLLFGYFILVTVIDIEHRLILHVVSLFGAGMALILGSFTHGVLNTLIGGVGGFTIMLILYWAGFLFVKLLRRAKNVQMDNEALGFGDVNLSGVIGLVAGWPGVLAVLVLAIILGGVVSFAYFLYLLSTKRFTHLESLPYGPFLAMSVLLLILFKNLIL